MDLPEFNNTGDRGLILETDNLLGRTFGKVSLLVHFLLNKGRC